MSRKLRIINAVGVTTLILSLLIGCGGGATPAAQPTSAPAAQPTSAPAAQPTKAPAAQPTSAPEAKPVTLSVWTGYPELEPLYKEVGAQLKKTHPNVTVEVLSTSLREFEQKLQAALPAGTGPDIFDVQPNIAPILVDGKLIDPNPPDVDQLLKSGIYTPYVVSYMTYDGKTYGIPMLDGSLASLYYNKAMFKEAGLDPNKPPATFEEVMAAAQKLVKYDASGNITRSGLSLRLSGQGSGIAEKFWFFLHNMGGEPVVPTKDGTKWHSGYNNDAGRKALKYHIDAIYKYHVDDQKVKHDAEAFEGEQTAMFLRESWVIGEIAQKNPKLEYGVAPMPKDIKWDTLTQPAGVYVSKISKNSALAWEFNKLLTNKENTLFQVTKTGWISPRRDVDWASLVKEVPQYDVFVNPPKEMGYYAYPLFSAFDEVLTKMADRLVAAYLDKSLLDNPDGIAKTIKAMADETDTILKQAGIYGVDP